MTFIDFDSVKAEMHGDIAITYGRYIAHTTGDTALGIDRSIPPDKRWFSVWFERVYAKRDAEEQWRDAKVRRQSATHLMVACAPPSPRLSSPKPPKAVA